VEPEAEPVALTARLTGGGAGAGGRGGAEQASRALAELAAAGITVDDFSLGQPSLDEVFLTLTGRPAEPGTGDDGKEMAA
jgi:ABC-2 type transport system ATP-binding protein